ncbi:LCP family protein [Streptomyces sp. NBC_00102]|uniref:LCP family protein n=1 Tax=Streptomyces sp. NBC_00102 TaxID=2975652 RepID=UPI0022566B5E|nr:LCP family protein [Streptomyces sp. NBC_00102]MCX5399112.1 LCP family protein [Streptomyces sp. NBC_00102]
MAIAASVLILGTAGTGGWVYTHLSGNIDGADVDDSLGGDRPEAAAGGENILVIGSDSREGLGDSYGKNLTTMQSDTLMLLHTGGDGKWASVVSFPRDSWVQIPSCASGEGPASKPHHFKINEAYAIGGSTGDKVKAAACTIKTVEANTHVRIDHFLIADFRGFKGMVNALGGVEVCPKEAIHDTKAHLDLKAGCQLVRDDKALGYVRARYSIGDGTDIGRIGRQQEFMQSLAARAKSKLYNPTALYGFLDSATKSLTADQDFAGIKPLYSLASRLKGIPADRISFLTVPNYPRERDIPTDKANVTWQQPAAHDLFTAMNDDRETTTDALKKSVAELPAPAGTVRVTVLNGTGTRGKAMEVAESLQALGFQIAATGNAPAHVGKTTLTYTPDQADGARALAGRLPGLTPAPAAPDAPAGITLTIGPDLPALTG